jgi:cytidylate kinase
MTKRAVISIAGSLGSGKSTTSRALARALNFEHFSAGDWQKNKADSMGLTLAEYHAQIEHDGSFDRMADDALTEAGKKENILIDAHLGFHFVPDAFHVFLILDPTIAAERMLKDAEENPMRHKEIVGGMESVEKILESIDVRMKSEAKRFFDNYGVKEHFNPIHFDITINTARNDLDTVVKMIIESYNAWRSS